ncbi:MAG: caspase family protein [Bacteroidales bacterium]|nr:caspase family protein [Bacteroidales bacterium]
MMRQRLTYIILSILLAAFSANAQTKRALVIGLGEQIDASWGKINGDKDVPLVCNMLKEAGFTNIQTLINAQATKTAIVNALQQLAHKSLKGDIIYIHFSGHGQQMTDIDGDESDERDEAWIPYDAYREYCAQDRGEKHLSDDELYTHLEAISEKIGANGKILVVVDACHSGDSLRGDDDEVVRGVFDIFNIPATAAKHSQLPSQEPWILISACKSYQVNSEMKTPTVGKLTYGMIKVLGEKEINDNAQFKEALENFMNQNRGSYPQQPTITGGHINKYSITEILR